MLDFAREWLNQEFSGELLSVGEGPVPHAAEAIVLGRQWNLSTVLKRAFYELARRDSLRLTATSEDVPCDQDHFGNDEDDEDDPIHELDPKDLVRLANGQKELTSAWLSAVLLGDVKCPLKTPCNSNKARITWDVVSPYLMVYQFDPICGIEKLIEVDWRKKGYCDGCKDARGKSLREQKHKVWENLSVWFDLE